MFIGNSNCMSVLGKGKFSFKLNFEKIPSLQNVLHGLDIH